MAERQEGADRSNKRFHRNCLHDSEEFGGICIAANCFDQGEVRVILLLSSSCSPLLDLYICLDPTGKIQIGLQATSTTSIDFILPKNEVPGSGKGI